MRVLQGGHDVPNAKLVARFPRTQAISHGPSTRCRTYSCTTTATSQVPSGKSASFEEGKPVSLRPPLPAWLAWQ